jgi:hypothetical protein
VTMRNRGVGLPVTVEDAGKVSDTGPPLISHAAITTSNISPDNRNILATDNFCKSL